MLRSMIVRQGHRTFTARVQHRPAFVDQIEAHMGGPVLAPFLPGTVRGQLDSALRDLRFRKLAVPGK